MSVLTNPRFLAAKTTLTSEVGQFLKDFGLDSERDEWAVLVTQLRIVLQYPIEEVYISELLDLLADRVKCEWDEMPLEFPVKDPDYAEAKGRWLESQDDLINAKCFAAMGSKFINNFGPVAA